MYDLRFHSAIFTPGLMVKRDDGDDDALLSAFLCLSEARCPSADWSSTTRLHLLTNVSTWSSIPSISTSLSSHCFPMTIA